MTGYFSAIIGDRIEILSDGAVYDSEGYLLDTQLKVKQLGDLPATIMTRGLVSAGEDLEEEIDDLFFASATVDGALVALESLLARRRETAQPHEPLEITICAVSESAGPIVVWFCTHAEPWQLKRTRTGLMDSREMPAEFHQQITRSATLADKGVFLMEELRKSPGKHITFESSEDWPCVGGHIDHTIIDRAGVHTSRLHTWPDKIGEQLVLEPSKLPGQRAVYERAAQAMRATATTAQPTMSRQQRRAAERAARRRAA